MELLILFDTQGYSSIEQRLQTGSGAYDRAATRNSMRAARGRTVVAEQTLQMELVNFKAAFMYVIANDVHPEQQAMFKVDERQWLIRLSSLAVIGHQPAVAAFVKQTNVETAEIESAIVMQKVGGTSALAKQIRQLKADAERLHGEAHIQAKRARLDVASVVRWKKRAAASTITVDLSSDNSSGRWRHRKRRASRWP